MLVELTMPARDPTARRAVILVGHGAVARDCPRGLVTRLRALERERMATNGAPTAEETALDERIRRWPRTPDSDPYKAGLEALAGRLRPLLDGNRLVLAYNEFCAPTLDEAVEELWNDGFAHITVVPSMVTPGGSHSERDIPEAIERLRSRHPTLTLQYAWPFDLDLLAGMLAAHLQHHEIEGSRATPPTAVPATGAERARTDR